MKSLSEEINEISRSKDLDYDAKLKALTKLTTKQEAAMILGRNPLHEIRLKEEIPSNRDLSDPDKLNILYLVIEKVYYDQIIAGTKKEEYRELKETTMSRYTYMDPSDKKRYLKPFDAVRLCAGYHKNRECAIVAINDITCDVGIVTFHFGKVIEVHRKAQ